MDNTYLAFHIAGATRRSGWKPTRKLARAGLLLGIWLCGVVLGAVLTR